MFNVAVLKLKDLMKFLIGMFIILLLIFFIGKFLKYKPNTNISNMENKLSFLSSSTMLQALDEVIPGIKNINKEYRSVAKEDDVHSEKNVLKAMLKTQLSSVRGLEEIEENANIIAKNENQEKNEETKQTSSQDTEKKEDNKIAEAGISTQIITKNPLADKSNAQYGKVKIKNETDYVLTEEMLKPDITIENKNVVIFHTHSCESYTSSEKYPYTPTGNYRTTDLNYTVTRVGTELENQLKNYNYNVVHSTDYHDYPAYNGSYTRSLKTVENMLKTTPSDIIIDLHRDAVGSRSDYAPTVKIGDEEAAQIMFVIGTNNGGLWHPNWNQNLKFAVKVQEKAEEMYPRII